MQIFKTDKKIYWANELKSWVRTFAIEALIFFGLKYFFFLNTESTFFALGLFLLIILSDTLTQYHVKEIQIDEQKQQITLKLNSRMSGEKIKIYELEQVTSELNYNLGLKRYLYSPLTLKIFLKSKDRFEISSRYGFTLDSLTSIDKILKTFKCIY